MSGQVERLEELKKIGILQVKRAYWNLNEPELYEEVIRRREGIIASKGPIVCTTGSNTGRSPNDKFTVRESSSEKNIHWGSVNRDIDAKSFDLLHADIVSYLADKEVYVLDGWAGADPNYRLPIRVVNELAWNNLFARNMFIAESDPALLAKHQPGFTVISAPGFKADPKRHQTRSDVFIVVHFGRKLVLVGGTSYAGEVKKSIFSVMNYLLPLKGVLSMHCSANIGPDGDTALFFGLSGTGKTTLSSDPSRRLIGDDEHGWSDTGVFNFEGGCYAKVIKLSSEAEPQIYATTRRFGTILENVVVDSNRNLDLDNDSLTENTRGSYPISFIDNAVASGQGGHPTNIVMLTADAYGVLPPIARLTPDGAAYHFLSGYTAKVAGTERGVTEPKAAFSTCFGAPFLPLNPNIYAQLLTEKIAAHNARVWLVNTGWTGGAYGTGSRMSIAHTRAMITAALTGALDQVDYQTHEIFNFDVPKSCPNVPAVILDPRGTWSDPRAYDKQASELSAMFVKNFEKFKKDVSPAVVSAGPKM